ncbi:hypothetical protein D3C78_1263740 [compost metagenome]
MDLGIHRQGGHRQGGAGRHIVREEFAINGVDRLQIRHVLQEDGDFHHIVHHMADAFDDGLDVIQALFGLHLDIARDHFACFGIDRQLGGNIIVMGERHSLSIWA